MGTLQLLRLDCAPGSSRKAARLLPGASALGRIPFSLLPSLPSALRVLFKQFDAPLLPGIVAEIVSTVPRWHLGWSSDKQQILSRLQIHLWRERSG
jgi:hypothetical protein